MWRQIAAEFHADASAIVGACHGRRDIEVVEDFFSAADTRAVLARVAELETEAVEGVVAVPGAGEVLSALAPDQWAAVTYGARQLMLARLHAAQLPVPPC